VRELGGTPGAPLAVPACVLGGMLVSADPARTVRGFSEAFAASIEHADTWHGALPRAFATGVHALVRPCVGALLGAVLGAWIASRMRVHAAPSRVRTAGELALSVVYTLVLCAVGWYALRAVLGSWPASHDTHAVLFLRGVRALGAWLFVALLAVAALDAARRMWLSARDLRMSRDELLREQRDEHGDPHIRDMRASLRRAAQHPPRTARIHDGARTTLVLEWSGRDEDAPFVARVESSSHLAGLHDTALVQALRAFPMGGAIPSTLFARVARAFAGHAQ